MKKIAVLGAGMVGRTIAYDLSKQFNVHSFDVSETNLTLLDNLQPLIAAVKCNLLEFETYPKIFNDFDFFVCAVPGFMGFKVMQHLIPFGKPIVDISFFPEDAELLQPLAKQYQTVAIVDAGVAPGLSNMVLGYATSLMQVEKFCCYVGGLPFERKFPFQYKAPFSPIDVIEEYTRPARLKENGKIEVRDALTEIEDVDVPGIGTLEAFNSDGLRSLLHTFPDIPNMKEKTLRYPGHATMMLAFKHAGFFNTEAIEVRNQKVIPIDLTAKLLIDQWKSDPNEKEFTVMKIDVEGNTNGKSNTLKFYLFDENDSELSSMSRTTGFTCTGLLHLMMENNFESGIHYPEQIATNQNYFNSLLEYLEHRNVRVSLTVTA